MTNVLKCPERVTAMALTDGLLQIQSQLARFRAYDEIAGTNKVGEYIGVIARGARPKQPLPEVPAGFADPRFDLDQVMRTIVEKRPTIFPAVPTIYTAIANHKDADRCDLSSITLARPRRRSAATGCKTVEPLEKLGLQQDRTGCSVAT